MYSGVRLCRECGKVKPLSGYRGDQWAGFSAVCRECEAVKQDKSKGQVTGGKHV